MERRRVRERESKRDSKRESKRERERERAWDSLGSMSSACETASTKREEGWWCDEGRRCAQGRRVEGTGGKGEERGEEERVCTTPMDLIGYWR